MQASFPSHTLLPDASSARRGRGLSLAPRLRPSPRRPVDGRGRRVVPVCKAPMTDAASPQSNRECCHATERGSA